MNNIILVGRLTRDVELRYLQGTGTAVGHFGIAVDREFSGKDGKKETDFIDIQVWGKVAENCANYLSKGSLVAIQGSLRIETYQNQAGETKRAAKVNANRVQFLQTKKDGAQGQGEGFKPSFEPSFEPSGLYPQGFQAIEYEEDLPF